jgi:SAM-dependent methyltransferase
VTGSREHLRATFESAAEQYDASRPSYPEELFDSLVELAQLRRGDRLLEIGCATGKATRPLLERGFSVVCVELGEQLAEQARRNLQGLPVQVHAAPFEAWSGEPRAFDLVFAATAWHWLDPEVRYVRAHRLLRPGGHLAFWSAVHAFPPGFDPFFSEIQEVYNQIGDAWEGRWPPPEPDSVPDDREEIENSDLFDDLQVRRFVWEVSYTADQYIALLDTFSNHIAMRTETREYLYREIRRRISLRSDPVVRREWLAILHVARSRDPDHSAPTTVGRDADAPP